MLNSYDTRRVIYDYILEDSYNEIYFDKIHFQESTTLKVKLLLILLVFSFSYILHASIGINMHLVRSLWFPLLQHRN